MTYKTSVAASADKVAICHHRSDGSTQIRHLTTSSNLIQDTKEKDKSIHVTFQLRPKEFLPPPVILGVITYYYGEKLKYPGTVSDKRLTWKPQIAKKRKQFDLLVIRRGNEYNLSKILIYKTIIKPNSTASFVHMYLSWMKVTLSTTNLLD